MTLKIAACIKQIPLIEEVNFDPVSKTIKRDGPNVMNALDLNAVSYAAEFKQRLGAETCAVTMGPPQAREVLIQALAMGLDRAVHLEDRAFAGADTLATARALAHWLRSENFNLILLGRYSLDAETGQVGPELAELLGFAQITNVIELSLQDGHVKAVRESDEGHEEIECELPAVLSCAERKARPPRVTPAALEAAKAAPIEVVRAASLDMNPQSIGAAGSPTSVKEVWIETPPKTDCKFIDCADPESAAREVVGELERRGVLGGPRPQRRPITPSLRAALPDRDVWVVYETDLRGQITRASLELMSAADQLVNELGGALVAVGFTGQPQPALLSSYGADRILYLEHPALKDARPEAVAQAMGDLVGERRPFALLVVASERGRDWGPRLAARMGLGLTGDAIGLRLEDGRMVALKPAFGGHVVAPIVSRTFPQMATVRSGVLELAEPAPNRGPAPVEIVRPRLPELLSRIVGVKPLLDPSLLPLDGADVVVGVGVGCGGPPGVERLTQFARRIGAALCATRRVTDLGWMPRQLQVGLTGRAIEPLLYIAVGVRGAANHTIGLKRIRAIIAINKDRTAPIFERANLGLAADWAQLIPALEEALRPRLVRS